MSDLENEMERRGLIKVSHEDAKESDPYRRVAKFLYLVGEEQAAKVLQKLTHEQIEKVVTEMLTIRYVDKDEAAYILSQFTALYNEAKHTVGGVETAENILKKAFGDEKAQAIIAKAAPPAPEKPFAFLEGIDVEKLIRILDDELPATKVLVLSQIKPQLAAAYITQLNDEEKKDIVVRLARLDTLNPEVLRTVSASMHEKCNRIQSDPTERIDGRAALAAILRRTDSDIGDFILQNLANQSPELEKDIRDRLFTLDDVCNADDGFLQKKLASMQDEEIASLIADKPVDFITKILSNVSKNRSRFILDAQQANPAPLHIRKTVTNQFLHDLRQNWLAGKLVVKGKDEQDVWIP